MQALPDYRLWCPVEGSTPIYTALVRIKKNKNIVLVNTTDTANIQLTKQGNYSCVASNRFGTDVKEFSVIFEGEECLTAGIYPERLHLKQRLDGNAGISATISLYLSNLHVSDGIGQLKTR